MGPSKPLLGGAALLIILLGLALSCPASLAKNIPKSAPLPEVWLRINGAVLRAEAPLTWEERRLGLGGRGRLAEGRAMAFIFAPPAEAQMTMRAMSFGLDFVWCRSGRVIGVSAEVPPGAPAPEAIAPPGPVDLVVEVPAGWARRHGIKAGSPVAVRPVEGTPRGAVLERLIGEMSR